MSKETGNKPGQNKEELAILLADIRAGRDSAFTRLLEKYESL